MAFFDNGNWGRGFMATQLAELQAAGIPPGEAWKIFLDTYNGLTPQLQQNIGNATSLAWGPNGFGGQTDALAEWQKQLEQQFSNVSSGQNTTNINNWLLDAIKGQENQVSNWFDIANRGSDQGNELYSAVMSNLNNPYNQNLGDIGGFLMSNLGQNPYNTSQQDMANYFMKQGGWDDKTGGIYDTGMGIAGAQGVTDAVGGGLKSGQDLMSQGMGMTQAGLNYQNPFLTAGSNKALDIISNNGASPTSNFLTNYIQSQLQGGPGTAQSNLQSGFDFANTLMNGGGVSDFITKGGNLAYDYASGGGPSIYNEMPAWLQNINTDISVGGGYGGGGGGAGSIAMPNVDSGYTASLNEILNKAKAILAENPLLDMNQAINMARDQAATATSQQYKAMMSRALARGGGPGATVASGLQNQGMAEYADAGAQAEAAAMRDAAKTQQGLQLQKYGIGADLAKAMEQVAAQRNATSSNLAGNIASANASLAASGQQNAQRSAELQAQINAQMAQAKMGLYGNLAGLNLQKMLGGLSGLQGFGQEADKMKLAGLAALPGLQEVVNNQQGNLLSAYLNNSGQQIDLTKAAMSSLGDYQKTAENAAIGRAGIGTDVLKTGTGLYDSMAKTASNNMLGGLDAANKAAGTAATNLNTWGGIANNAANNQLNWAKLGVDMTNSNINNTQKVFDLLSTVNKNNNDFQLGAGTIANNLWNTQNTGLNNAVNNSQNADNFSLNKFLGYNTAKGQQATAANTNMSNLASLIANSQNTYANLANTAMSPLNSAIQGMAGINPTGLSGMGLGAGLLNTLVGAGVNYGTSFLPKPK